jgi:hypothetical protein
MQPGPCVRGQLENNHVLAQWGEYGASRFRPRGRGKATYSTGPLLAGAEIDPDVTALI